MGDFNWEIWEIAHVGKYRHGMRRCWEEKVGKVEFRKGRNMVIKTRTGGTGRDRAKR